VDAAQASVQKSEGLEPIMNNQAKIPGLETESGTPPRIYNSLPTAGLSLALDELIANKVECIAGLAFLSNLSLVQGRVIRPTS